MAKDEFQMFGMRQKRLNNTSNIFHSLIVDIYKYKEVYIVNH